MASRIDDKWRALYDAGEALLARTQNTYILDGFSGLELATRNTLSDIGRFVRLHKTEQWISIPARERVLLLQRTEKAISTVSDKLAGIYGETAKNAVGTLNRATAQLSLPIGTARVNPGWVSGSVVDFKISQDLWGKRTATKIYNTLKERFESGNLTGLEASIREAAGVPRDLRKYWRECVKESAAQGNSGPQLLKVASKIYHEKYGGLTSAAADVDRIVRTESARAWQQNYDDWESEFSEDVFGEEFVAEADACDDCADLAGKYENDSPSVPVHPNCRCHLRPLIRDYDETPKNYKDIREMKRSNGKSFEYRSRADIPTHGSVIFE